MNRKSKIIAQKTKNSSFFLLLFAFAVVFALCGLTFADNSEQPEAIQQQPAPAAKTDANMPEPATTAGIAKPAPAPEKDPNAVVITVNGATITQGRIEKMIEPQLRKMSGQIPAMFLNTYKSGLRQRAAEGLIGELLLDEKMKETKTTATEEEVISQIEEMASQQKLSLEDFKSLLNAYGKSFEEVKEQIQKGLSYQKLLEKQWAGKINVTQDDAKKFYDENKQRFKTPEQIKASHILIKPDISDPTTDPNQAKAAAAEKAQKLLDQIKNGADFAELARANSDGPSAKNGGDLKFFRRGQMTPAFEKAAFALKPGQVSDDVVETRFGYHIIKVTDHKDAGVTTFEQAKDDIVEELTQTKKGKIAMEYIDSLKTAANIVYLDPTLKKTPPMQPGQKPAIRETAPPETADADANQPENK